MAMIKAHTLELKRPGESAGKQAHKNSCCEPADKRCSGGPKQLNLLERSGARGEILGLAPAEVTIVVAAESGAVKHVIHPSRLPAGCVPI